MKRRPMFKVVVALMTAIIMTLLPNIARACSIIVHDFYPWPVFWPVVLSMLLAGIVSYRGLKNYPRNETVKIMRPFVAGLSSLFVACFVAFAVFLVWPGNAKKDMCPSGWKLQSSCFCASPNGMSERANPVGSFTINPKARLKSIGNLKQMFDRYIEEQEGYDDKTLIKPFER